MSTKVVFSGHPSNTGGTSRESCIAVVNACLHAGLYRRGCADGIVIVKIVREKEGRMVSEYFTAMTL